jgi:predicted RNA-binding protein YlqC (UPF0109 family)
MSDDTEKAQEQFEELTRFMAAHLMGSDDLEVTSSANGGQINLKLATPEKLRGRVIGRGGRIARSMRTLLETAAIPTHLRPSLDIVD